MRIGHARAASVGLIACVALATGCGGASKTPEDSVKSAEPRPWLTMEPLAMPATEPGLAPQLTRSSRGLTLSWVASTDKASALRFSEWDGTRWSANATASTGTNWFLSWADVPSVLRLANGSLVASWLVNTRPEIEAYDLLLSYSKDDGRTWATPFKAHQDRTQTQHGFASPLDLADKGFGLVWLDGRDMENNTTDPEGGVMTLRFTQFDRDWKRGADVEVNTRVCECCQTAAVLSSDGIVTAFRDRSNQEIRDIAIARLDHDRWTPPTTVHADNYKSLSCPVNGPALSARGNALATAWYTVENETGHAFAAFSPDAGRTWTAPIRLDDGKSLGMVDIELLDDGSAAATWVEFADGKRHFKVRRVEPGGHTSPAMDVAGQTTGRVSGYPRLERSGNELIFAWAEGSGDSGGEDGGGQTIKGAIARLAH